MSIFNDASCLEASIQSMVDQTFGDWEFIIWNDASTDGSYEKLMAWSEKDHRIKVFSNEQNLGLAASLNKALEKSTGEYIARMDGDDRALPDRLAVQVDFLDNHPEFSIVSGGCILFDQMGEWGKRSGKEIPEKRDFLWGSQFLHPASIMRRDDLLAVGGYRVCKDTQRAQDYDLFMRMYAKGYKGYNLEGPLLYYFESKTPQRKRRFTYRIGEAKIRYHGFKALGLLPGGLIYVIKPLIVGLIPYGMKRNLRGFYFKLKGVDIQ